MSVKNDKLKTIDFKSVFISNFPKNFQKYVEETLGISKNDFNTFYLNFFDLVEDTLEKMPSGIDFDKKSITQRIQKDKNQIENIKQKNEKIKIDPNKSEILSALVFSYIFESDVHLLGSKQFKDLFLNRSIESKSDIFVVNKNYGISVKFDLKYTLSGSIFDFLFIPSVYVKNSNEKIEKNKIEQFQNFLNKALNGKSEQILKKFKENKRIQNRIKADFTRINDLYKFVFLNLKKENKSFKTLKKDLFLSLEDEMKKIKSILDKNVNKEKFKQIIREKVDKSENIEFDELNPFDLIYVLSTQIPFGKKIVSLDSFKESFIGSEKAKNEIFNDFYNTIKSSLNKINSFIFSKNVLDLFFPSNEREKEYWDSVKNKLFVFKNEGEKQKKLEVLKDLLSQIEDRFQFVISFRDEFYNWFSDEGVQNIYLKWFVFEGMSGLAKFYLGEKVSPIKKSEDVKKIKPLKSENLGSASFFIYNFDKNFRVIEFETITEKLALDFTKNKIRFIPSTKEGNLAVRANVDLKSSKKDLKNVTYTNEDFKKIKKLSEYVLYGYRIQKFLNDNFKDELIEEFLEHTLKNEPELFDFGFDFDDVDYVLYEGFSIVDKIKQAFDFFYQKIVKRFLDFIIEKINKIFDKFKENFNLYELFNNYLNIFGYELIPEADLTEMFVLEVV